MIEEDFHKLQKASIACVDQGRPITVVHDITESSRRYQVLNDLRTTFQTRQMKRSSTVVWSHLDIRTVIEK